MAEWFFYCVRESHNASIDANYIDAKHDAIIRQAIEFLRYLKNGGSSEIEILEVEIDSILDCAARRSLPRQISMWEE